MRLSRIAIVGAMLAAGSSALAQHAAPRRPPAAHPAARPGRPGHGHGSSSPPPSASAAPLPIAEDPNVMAARQAYQAGRAALDAHNYDEALTNFQRANQLRPNPVVLLPISQAQEGLGHIPDAISTLEQYLHDRPDAPDHAAVETRLEGLRTHPGTIHVAGDPPGAAIIVDGQRNGSTTPTDVSVPPGHHIIRLEMAGFRSDTQELDVPPGGRAEVSGTMIAEGPSASASPGPTAVAHHGPSVSPVVVIAAIVAGGAAVAGSVFGFMALDAQSTYNMTPTDSTRNNGETYAVLSDVFFGTAILGAVVGVVVFVAGDGERGMAGTASRGRGHSGPRFSASPGGLSVSF